MNRRPVAKTSWFTVLLIIAAVALWALDQKRGADRRQQPQSRQAGNPTPASKPPPRHAERSASKRETTGAYEVYRDCTLVEARNNDGDSFMVRLRDGRTAEFRLYFVDTPESAFKRYAGGDTNHARIRQQAAEMGGITPEQAVAIGKQGKTLTLGLLGSRPFTVFTCWDSPFRDERFHAFVEVMENGKTRWLHEWLTERGLVRLKTKAADLPDGTSASRHREHLRDIERQAKRNRAGVWGL